MVEYFKPVQNEEGGVVRRIKGNYRRGLVQNAVANDGLDSIPDAWLRHEISEVLKNFLQQQHTRARGGEDLPDLQEGEVEIARLTLADSVHGEVTSLRACPRQEGGYNLRIVDEYATDISPPFSNAEERLTSEEIVGFFHNSDPSQTAGDLKIEFQSYFHDDLNEVAFQMGVIEKGET